MAEVFERNSVEIRERLYQGALAREVVLDIPALDRLFSRTSTIRGHDFRRAMTLLDAEAWVQSWA